MTLFKSLISQGIVAVISLINLTMTSVKYTVTDSLESGHYCTKSYFSVSVTNPSTLYRTVRNIANIDRPSFIAELSSASEFSSVEKANQYSGYLSTVLDNHANNFCGKL